MKVVIYGYLNCMGCCGKLGKGWVVNMEVMWVLRKVRGEFGRVCDLGKDNLKGKKKVYK